MLRKQNEAGIISSLKDWERTDGQLQVPPRLKAITPGKGAGKGSYAPAHFLYKSFSRV